MACKQWRSTIVCRTLGSDPADTDFFNQYQTLFVVAHHFCSFSHLCKLPRWHEWFHLATYLLASNPGFPFQILCRSFGEKLEKNRFFSKAARQHPEWKAWVRGYIPPLMPRLFSLCVSKVIFKQSDLRKSQHDLRRDRKHSFKFREMLETQEYTQAQDAEDSRQPEVKEKLHINMC